MVWLPGAFHSLEDFLEAGFDVEVRARSLPIDVEFVDVELEHLGDRRALARLQRDIVAPARALGCRSIWLAGISLGGFMVLDYAASRCGQWDGLCLLAPYLGNRMLIEEIARVPGVAAWQPGALADCDEERRIWRFIQAQRTEPRPIYLGYGRADRFAAAHALMAEVLPPSSVDLVPGSHDWPTWSMLWGRFLDSRFK